MVVRAGLGLGGQQGRARLLAGRPCPPGLPGWLAGVVRVQVEPRRLEVVPGEPVAFQIEIYNSRNVIDAYTVTLLGLDGPETGGAGVSVVTEPRSLSLFPETEGTLTVLCTLPLGFPAGPRTIGVATVSTTDASVSVVEDIEVVVAAVRDLSIEVRPQSVTGGRRALLGLTVDNRGNVPVDLAVRASDAEGLLRFSLEHPHLVVPPASTVRTRVAVSGRRPLVGSPTPRIVTLAVQEDGGQTREAIATFIQKPLLPRALLTLAAVVGALALWAAVLFQGVDQAVDDVAESTAQAEVAAAGTGVVAGQVSGPSGPLGGVMVTLAGSAEATTTSLTDGEIGSYRFAELVTPGSYVLTFAKEGFASQTFTVELAEDEVVTGRDVVLATETGSITGTVVDDTGAAVGGVAVTVSAAGPDGAEPVDPDPAAPPDAVTMESGSVGFFAVSGLPAPGDYVLTFAKEGFVTATHTVSLTADEGGVDMAPELARLHTASIAGLVRADRLQATPCTPAQCGLGGVEIEVTSADVSVAVVSAGSPDPGRYRAGELPAGRFTVTFSAEGYQTQAVDVEVAADQEFQLDVALAGEPGLISGAASGCTGVELRLGDLSPLVPPRSEVLDGGDDDFSFADLRTPATYRVVFSGPEVDGFRDVQVVDVDLGAAGARADVDATCATAPPPAADTAPAVAEPPVSDAAVSEEGGREVGLLPPLLGRR